ncbi:hypothetical protein Plhal304r1_c003g0010201 [Plasmopara halstedii]
MPLWYNVYFTFGKAKTPLAEINFVERYGCFATQDLLNSLLQVHQFASPASKTRLVSDTIARLNLICPPHRPIYGPTRPIHIECATHGWNFEDKMVIDMSNRDFVKLLLKTKLGTPLPKLQVDKLQIADLPLTNDIWRFEYRLDRHVLPICSDLKTEVISSNTCVHGCTNVEVAQHLFWACRVAIRQWEWSLIVFPHSIRLQHTTIQHYGTYTFYAIFTMVRCCVLRALWLHRNKRLYNIDVSTSRYFVRHHVFAYIKLHFRQFQSRATFKGKLTWIQLLHEVENSLHAQHNAFVTSTTTASAVQHSIMAPMDDFTTAHATTTSTTTTTTSTTSKLQAIPSTVSVQFNSYRNQTRHTGFPGGHPVQLLEKSG